MNGLISILPPFFREEVLYFWDLLSERFGVDRVKLTGTPHITRNYAERYLLDDPQAFCRSLARSLRPLRCRTNGLGIFSGKRPVIYIAFMMDAELERFHRRIWEAIAPVAVTPNKRYHPERWIPHVTLAMEDLTLENIGPITAFLCAYKWKYAFKIESLSWVTRNRGENMTVEKTFGINTEEASH
ncbi:MAG TPA: 2'-5' RNA ligase family protein [Thermotogota bacterium]|nr:2'-5' RNA ligase family protein [Thermotogota bacterium]